mmetsp:Transcript_212/g.416  ORF Transcript_212/g.416 Transcript_212/m.416 type:complete len:246 (-) Transcript_212:223-960(-)
MGEDSCEERKGIDEIENESSQISPLILGSRQSTDMPESDLEGNHSMKSPLAKDDQLAQNNEDHSQPQRILRPPAPVDPLHFICKLFNVEMVGNNYILLRSQQADGEPWLTVGPHWGGTVFTTGIILVGTYFLVGAISTKYPLYIFIALVFCLVCNVTLWLTACTDPGILRHSAVGDNLKFCDRCNLYQPFGTHHCTDCGCCIEEHDHHCPWMGKCLGKKNILYFYAFNLSWFLYLIYLFVIIINV